MNAVARAVEVVVLIPEVSDFWIADWVSLSYARELLNAGVRIYRYCPTVLHTKLMIVDECWATVGSCNMDPLSFFHNRESNMIINDRGVAMALHKDFLNDLNNSSEITFRFLNSRPFWQRMLARFARLLRPLL
jgi:cardiolipin synthase